MGEESSNLTFAHFPRVPFVMKQNEALDPIKVSLFGANTVVLATNDFTDLIEKFRLVE
jgi:hypothetical protein